MLKVRHTPPEGARVTKVHVMCPDNHLHGAVCTLSTFDGAVVDVDFTAAASEVESVMPAEDAVSVMKNRQLATPGDYARNPEGAAQYDALVRMVAAGNPIAVSADPEDEGERVRYRVRCPRPSCDLDLPLTVPAMNALEEATRKVWAAGMAELEVPDVRHWLAVAMRQ